MDYQILTKDLYKLKELLDHAVSATFRDGVDSGAVMAAQDYLNQILGIESNE